MGEACSTQGKIRNTYKILVGKPEGKRLFVKNRGEHWRMVLNCMLRKYGVSTWVGFIWIRIGPNGGLL
jgi:hypothetical protein